MKFIKIDWSNYQIAIKLQREIFPRENGSLNILASLDFDLFEKFTGQKYPDEKLSYWLAQNDEKEIVGLTGLYVRTKEEKEAWLGWFGVKQEFRGQGYGQEILTWTIRQARKQKFNTLRLYTDAVDNYSATLLYQKLGFRGEKYEIENLPYDAWIYSLSLTADKVSLWGNKNLKLINQENWQNLEPKEIDKIISAYNDYKRNQEKL